jgi:hypothetical protein
MQEKTKAIHAARYNKAKTRILSLTLGRAVKKQSFFIL